MDYTELLLETFTDAVVGFGNLDKGLSEERVENLVYGILEAGVKAPELHSLIKDRLVPMLLGRLENEQSA